MAAGAMRHMLSRNAARMPARSQSQCYEQLGNMLLLPVNKTNEEDGRLWVLVA